MRIKLDFCSLKFQMMKKQIAVLFLALFAANIYVKSASAAPAVVFKVDASLKETGLFNDTVQLTSQTLLGGSGSWSDTMTNNIQSSTGMLSASMSGSLNFANGVVTAQQHGSMTYSSNPTFTFLGDHLFAHFGITAYVLGAPGTAYTLTSTSDAMTTHDSTYGPNGTFKAIGWSNPGWFYYWANGSFTQTWQGVSEATTINFDGQVYSKVKVGPTIDSEVGWAMTNYWGGTSTGTVDSTFRFEVTTAASVASVSAVPEPETYAMLLTGLGLLGSVVRRRRARAVGNLTL